MKITSDLISTLVIAINLIAIFPTTPTTQAAPISVGLKTADFLYAQDCLYNDTAAKDASTLCHRLLNPTDEPIASRFTPAEQSIRFVFLTEAAAIQSLYEQFSDCRARTIDTLDQPAEQCKLTISNYRGLFLRNFTSNSYGLAGRFSHPIWDQVNPLTANVKHCVQFHGEGPRALGAPANERRCAPYGDLTRDNLLERYPRLTFTVYRWMMENNNRHGIRMPSDAAYRSGEARLDDIMFDCLYYPSARGDTDKKDICTRIMTPAATAWALNFSLPDDGSERQGLDQTQQHYWRLARADRFYDCLKYHRHEREAVHWCGPALRRVNQCRYADGRHPDPLIDHVVSYIEEEDKKEMEDIEVSWLPFLGLSKRLYRLCDLYQNEDGSRPEDCEEGGLYWPLINPVERPAEEVPEF